MSEDLDFPTKEDALRDVFSFVNMIFNNLLQTGTIIFERLYTYRKSLYQLFSPFPQ